MPLGDRMKTCGDLNSASYFSNRSSGRSVKLSTTTRTRETVAEYAAMSKEDKNRCKDVGGFVAGYLKGGKRNNASVVNRCAVCLDADDADPGLLDDLDMTFINAYALYSTHSHTPERMRLRIIIPLARTVTPDEYAAVARRIANDLTLTRFDPTTFEPARLMYWPSTPEDGDYVFRYEDAPFLDPDAVLASYFKAGEPLYLTTELEAVANQEQVAALESDVREGMIAEYLNALLPEDWDSMDISERRAFLRGDMLTAGNRVGTVKRTAVSAVEIWAECFGRDPATIKRADTYDIFGMLMKIGGWEKYTGNKNGSIRRPPYGPQRCYIRSGADAAV